MHNKISFAKKIMKNALFGTFGKKPRCPKCQGSLPDGCVCKEVAESYEECPHCGEHEYDGDVCWKCGFGVEE